jgi:hypothetical protein
MFAVYGRVSAARAEWIYGSISIIRKEFAVGQRIGAVKISLQPSEMCSTVMPYCCFQKTLLACKAVKPRKLGP